MLFIQKLITVLFMLIGLQAFAAEPSTPIMVPDLGSSWESTLTYTKLSDYGEQRRKKELYTVVRLQDGRPVFAGEVFGYKGEIIESDRGTVVYTDDCKEAAAAAASTAPEVPNQCVWNACYPEEVGKTLTRPMIFYVSLYACEPKVATYRFTSKRVGQVNGMNVTIGEAKVYLGPFNQTTWTSYIRDGYGEVYAESSARETTYQKIEVTHVQYQPTKLGKVVALEIPTPVIPITPQVPKHCDVVAFGDSLTEGLGASHAESYPAQLSKILGKEVCNLGMSGSTTQVAKQRVTEILELKPKIVIVTLGANDAFRGFDPSETERNLGEILDMFLKKDILVVVLGFDSVVKSMPNYIGKMLAAYKVAKNREGILYLPDAFTGVLDTPTSISGDGQHPNAKGYEKLAKNVMEQAFGTLLVVPSAKSNN